MDESPLSLFGDQTKRSINDINTCNEVEGCLSNKVRTFLIVRYTKNVTYSFVMSFRAEVLDNLRRSM